MSAGRPEKVYEKHAWIIFLLLGIFFLGLSLRGFITGMPNEEFVKGSTGMTWSELVAANPGLASFISHLMRTQGIFGMMFGGLTIAISLRSYRKRERWSWYALLIIPVVFGFASVISTPDNILFAILALLGLLLPYRRFLPKGP